MKKLNRLFGNIPMTWPVLLLFAVIAGVYTGLINLVPFLQDTSFTDIAVTYEWWVLFAVIVVTNCKKPVEAALKCFVFFLISQPLVYGVEILAGKLTLQMGIQYYKQFWFFMTLLTLPGGFIAYFAKKQNVIGSLILGVGCTIEFFMGVHFIYTAVNRPPYHLLSAVFSFAVGILLTLILQKQKRNRIITLSFSLGITAALTAFCLIMGRGL